MREIMRTNNPALISFVESLLKEIDVRYMVADRHISIVEGSIGAIPRRILVDAEDEARARRFLIAADLASELRPARGESEGR